MILAPEELLAGGALTYEVEVPPHILSPNAGDAATAATAADAADAATATRAVRLRPLTVRDLQLISRAAKESDSLIATLMVQRALVEPEMNVAQVAAMHVGLVQFLLEQVNHISGIAATNNQITSATESPLVKAAFVLASEFGWTPEQVSQLTLGQVLLHLEMLKEKAPT